MIKPLSFHLRISHNVNKLLGFCQGRPRLKLWLDQTGDSKAILDLCMTCKPGSTDVETVHTYLNHLNTCREWGCRDLGTAGLTPQVLVLVEEETRRWSGGDELVHNRVQPPLLRCATVVLNCSIKCLVSARSGLED